MFFMFCMHLSHRIKPCYSFRWAKRDQNVLFEYGEERSIVCNALMEKRFEGFTQKDIMATSHALLRFWSIDANSYYFTKQDLTFKQAHLVSFCFVPCNQPKFCQLTLVFSAFCRLYLEIALFCTKPSAQIFLCHMTDVNFYNCFGWLHDTIGLWLPWVSGTSSFSTLQSRNIDIKSVGTKVDFWEKCTLSLLHNGLSI